MVTDVKNAVYSGQAHETVTGIVCMITSYEYELDDSKDSPNYLGHSF